MSDTDIVRACFAAYLAQDQDTAAQLIAENFVFTSPQDDHIDKAAFLQRCFPPPTVSRPKTSSNSSARATAACSSSTSTS
ncbi:hypothetical protein BH24ACT14_BH24ACT14_05780 [soil metagenome]